MDTSSERLDRAIAWHVRLNDAGADEDTWQEFTVWLEADPANRAAYDRVDALGAELDSVGARVAVRAIGNDRSGEPTARRAASWIAGAAVLAASLLAVFYFGRGSEPVTYTTAIGETKTVTLADGSRVDLNTATSISVSGDNSRQVTLDRGEALFHVAKDPVHPFVVTAGARRVRVVGTVFNVLRAGGAMTVVVAEGRVAVSQAAEAGDETVLGPGDRLVCVELGTCSKTGHVDAAQAMSWRKGYLVYRDAPLSAVIADLNRYFPAAIVVEDGAGAERFTGVLRIDDQDAVLRRISQLLPVTVQRRADGRIALRPAPAKP